LTTIAIAARLNSERLLDSNVVNNPTAPPTFYIWQKKILQLSFFRKFSIFGKKILQLPVSFWKVTKLYSQLSRLHKFT
jgi:hypothetical protein